MDCAAKRIFLGQILFAIILDQPLWISGLGVKSSDDHSTTADDDSPDPGDCSPHLGEYYRDTYMKVVCCGNESLTLPDALMDSVINDPFVECSQQFSKDDTSDFPTGMWKAFLCKLHKSSVFKTKDKLTFAELMSFITQKYPAHVTTELKKHVSKCTGIDGEKVEDHVKIQKYMDCYLDAENKTCHKPQSNFSSTWLVESDIQKTKELGCPVVPGLEFSNSIEYCCKKQATPYPILHYPVPDFLSDAAYSAVEQCRASFAKREKELMPEAFKVATPSPTDHDDDDGDDHDLHSHWDTLCMSACVVNQKNYTSSMLKLDFENAAKYYLHQFGKRMREDLMKILKRRKSKDKIFLTMDPDSDNSKPMTYKDLSKKFAKAAEKDKIQYYCKFVATVEFEERRALHEYCFDEKYGNEWGDEHHSFFVHDDHDDHDDDDD